MTNAAFCDLADELHGLLFKAADEFFRSHGIKPDWNAYWQNMTADKEQNVREILMFAGDLWVEHEECTQHRQTA